MRLAALAWRVAMGAVLIVLALAVLVVGLSGRDDLPEIAGASPMPAGAADRAAQIERGAALARIGGCAGCHTARGGVPYAGGRAIPTPFGAVVAPNLTPDEETGLGGWTAAQFWRALHNGRGRDGRALSPAFPYTAYTRVERADADAIFAWLRSLPAVRQPRAASSLRFPFDRPAALAVWRALFFQPGVYQPDPRRSARWNRGAYLVQGLGHCEGCHTARNALGGPTGPELGGGAIAGLGWDAPSLRPRAGAAEGAGAVPTPDAAGSEIALLLARGQTARHAVLGPMAEVVAQATQYLPASDLEAMVDYLQNLPPEPAPQPAAPAPVPAAVLDEGAALYRTHCARCHGDAGEGGGLAYPPLAGNRTVLRASPTNLLRVILGGGYPPSTAGQPRPYGMPPYAATLDDGQTAALATWLRRAWGGQAGPVSALEVFKAR